MNQAYSPPAVFDEQIGAWLVDCRAIPPKFGITIRGTPVYMAPEDMILEPRTPEMFAQFGDRCICANQDTGRAVSLLGEAFLKSFVAVFDVGAAEMRFAAHSY